MRNGDLGFKGFIEKLTARIVNGLMGSGYGPITAPKSTVGPQVSGRFGSDCRNYIHGL